MEIELKKLDSKIMVGVSKELMTKIIKECNAQEVNMSTLIRNIVIQWFKNKERGVE